MIEATFLRGEVWAATLPGMTEEKYYLVVSSNARNRTLKTALVVRITSSNKPDISSIVRIPSGECVTGRILCDDIEDIWPEDARRRLGALSVGTMHLVNDGLKIALSLS